MTVTPNCTFSHRTFYFKVLKMKKKAGLFWNILDIVKIIIESQPLNIHFWNILRDKMTSISKALLLITKYVCLMGKYLYNSFDCVLN